MNLKTALKTVISSSLLLITGCTSLGYSVWGVDTDEAPRSDLQKIRLISFDRDTSNRSFVLCQTDSGRDDIPRCMASRYTEFLRLREELSSCGVDTDQYKIFGVATENVSPERLDAIELVGFERRQKDESFAICRTTDEDIYPRCVVIPYPDFIRLREALYECREEERNGRNFGKPIR